MRQEDNILKKKFWNFLGIDNNELSLENKLFNIACFVINLSTLMGLAINLVVRFSFVLGLFQVMILAYITTGFFISRIRGYKENFTLILINFGIIIFAIIWFYAGGFEGFMTQASIFFTIIILVIITRKYHFHYVGLMMITITICYFIEKKFPQTITLNDGKLKSEVFIFAFSNLFIFCCGVLINFIKKANERDKEVILSKSKELEESKKELQIAKDKAEEATAAKTNFLANMSHEIRTPLNGIIGTAELLSRSNLNQDQQQLLDILQSSSNLLIHIVSDILYLSKIEVNKLALNPQPTNIRTCIDNVFQISKSSIIAANKNIDLVLEVDSQMASYFIFDESRVQQILLNLVSNAIKFTEVGQVSVKLEAKQTTDDIQEITFIIKDTGIGISEQAIKKLFTPFTQVDNTNIRKYGGTGLGLSICKKLVQMMGGCISVDSILGVGSIFSFTIPLKIAIAKANKETIIPAEKTEDKKSIKILVAEDNKINQRIAVKIFEKIGYQVDLADNGQIAVDMQQQNQYNFIFMDIQMPIMDGIQATREIMATQYTNMPLVVAMTANVFSEHEEACRDAGMVDFMSKPFTIERLESVIEGLLNLSNA